MKEHKFKIVALIIILMLGWLVYLAFQEYSTESRVCLEKGGTLTYDIDNKTLYCKMPPRVKKQKSWWEW